MKEYKLKKENTCPLNSKIDYKNELNEEQLNVVLNGEGPCLVLAGAGSGKTRTLVYRVAYLIERGIDPKNILLVTFTNKAAREMLNRVETLLKCQPKGLWGGTFHHIGNMILRRYAKLLGYENNFNILDEEDSKNLLKAVMGEMRLDYKDKYFPKTDVILNIISFASNSQKPILDVITDKYNYLDPKLIPVIEAINKEYQKKKLKTNVMDFDDLLTNWLELLKKDKDIKAKLSAQFKYILVDEYQDTNRIQGEIVYHLASVHNNVLVVGDDCQSIYSFRAADINNILEFPKKFKKTKIFKLVTNYRSSHQILDLANHSIANNVNQYKKELEAIKEGAVKPALVPTKDSYQQAEFVAQRVLELQEEGDSLNDMAILFRSSFQVMEMELELNKRNIPYVMRGGIKFFEQAHIKDVVAYLKIFANFKDELAWKRVLLLYEGIGPSNAERIWQEVNKHSDLKKAVAELLNLPFSIKVTRGLEQLNSLLEILLKQEKDFIATAIRAILKNNYEDYIKNNFENAKDRIEDLVQLANFALNYEKLEDFLSDVTLSESFKGEAVENYEEGPDEQIVLSTIHQAKGLEWKYVFILGLVEGQFPHYKIYDRPQEIEEERRLFYVAVTRAKDELYLTYPIISTSYLTGANINRPSTFVSELDSDLFEEWRVDDEDNNNDIDYDAENPFSGHEFLKTIRYDDK